jgi:formate hydrogenlyase subunit 4
MNMIVGTILHLLLLFLLPPLLLGVIGKTKALFGGRVGAPFLQPYYDLAKLFRKGFVFSDTTTWVFSAGPTVGLAVPVLAALLIPFGGLAAPISFSGDLILFVYLFALARFFTVASALDTGSSFEGMGGAREVTFSCLVEPTILFAFIVLVRVSGSLSLGGMFGPDLREGWTMGGAALGLILVCLFVVLLVENCRIPFDDPNTHLELTMIHEVMVLDHSGPAFGMILYGAAMKLFVLGALVVRLALPWQTGSLPGDAALFIAGMLLLAVLIGVVESVMARLRLVRIPQVLIGTTLISVFALVLVLR